jgi:NAD(P) transhydrogenase
MEELMEELQVDYAVIGSGPAGQKAAIQAAKLGKKVVIIEKDSQPGGVSLHSGTIPSKALREAILDLSDFYKNSFYAQAMTLKKVSVGDLNFRLHTTLDAQEGILLRQLDKNYISLIKGTAQFENSHTLVVFNEEKNISHRIHFSFCLISTGSKPRHPVQVPFDRERIFDSTGLLYIEYVPKTMIVVGGGIIGAEYASFFSALGTEVTVVDKRDRLLPSLDREIGLHLQTALSTLGLQMVGGREISVIARTESGVEVTCKEGLTLQADVLLYALGREANVENLCIEKAGVSLNSRGYVSVNALFQTGASHIYAAGDVIGSASLASTSMEEGRLAARHAFGEETHHFPTFYPVGIYTIPEISCCGKTEEELQALGFRYEIGRAYYYEIARNQIVGNDPGLFKILFHAETLEILGVHIIGRSAAELIHIGQVAMSFHAKIDYFMDQVFNYPTYAEGYRIAALNGYNKVKHHKA